MNWFRKDQLDIINLDDDKEAKIEYIMKEVNDWLNRMRTFREEETSDELLKMD